MPLEQKGKEACFAGSPSVLRGCFRNKHDRDRRELRRFWAKPLFYRLTIKTTTQLYHYEMRA
jgi:hypothetical protein